MTRMLLTDDDRQHAEHLGDGLYARFDGYQIWLFASDGETKTKPVALEPSTYGRLRQFASAKWNGEPGVYPLWTSSSKSCIPAISERLARGESRGGIGLWQTSKASRVGLSGTRQGLATWSAL